MKGNIDSPRQRMNRVAHLAVYHVQRKPGNQLWRRPVIEAGDKPGVSHGPCRSAAYKRVWSS